MQLAILQFKNVLVHFEMWLNTWWFSNQNNKILQSHTDMDFCWLAIFTFPAVKYYWCGLISRINQQNRSTSITNGWLNYTALQTSTANLEFFIYLLNFFLIVIVVFIRKIAFRFFPQKLRSFKFQSVCHGFQFPWKQSSFLTHSTQPPASTL